MNVDPDTCMYCGSCVGICPRGAVTLNDTLVSFSNECNRCGLCVVGCPVGAICEDDEEGCC